MCLLAVLYLPWVTDCVDNQTKPAWQEFQSRNIKISNNFELNRHDAKNFKWKELRRLQEESASPMLKKVESQEREVKVNLEDMKEEEGCFRKGASAGGSTQSHLQAKVHTHQDCSQGVH